MSINFPLFFNGDNPNPFKPLSAEEKGAALIKRTEVVKSVSDSQQLIEREFKKHSILQSSRAALEEVISLIGQDQTFHMLNLAYSLEGTGFEGGNLAAVANVYLALFRALDNIGIFCEAKEIPQDVYVALEQLKISALFSAAEIADKIAALEVGKSYVMRGGWYAEPAAHAMIYRFERTGDESFNIYLYNAQNGVHKLQGGVKKIGRVRVRPCMLFEDVKWSELFFCKKSESINPILFEKLLAVLSRQRHTQNIKSVLDCFFHIQSKLASSENLKRNNLFIAVQPSGNCPVKSTNCMLLDLINDRQIYKKLSLGFRFVSQLARFFFVTETEHPIEERKVMHFQLKEAASNFLNVLNTNFLRKTSSICESDYVKASASMQNILWSLSLPEEVVELPVGGDYSQETAKKLREMRVSYSKSLAYDASRGAGSQEGVEKTLPLNPELGKGCSWKECPTVITSLRKLVEKLLEATRYQDAVFQVEATLKNLSILKAMPMSGCTVNELILLQELVLALQSDYNNATYKLDDFSSPATANTAMEFVALNYSLAVAIDQLKNLNVLHKYGIDVRYFLDAARKNLFYCCQDPSLLQQRSELEIFFEQHSCDPIFGFGDHFFHNADAFLNEGTVEGRLYKSYIAQDEEVKESLQDLVKSNPSDERFAIHGALKCFEESAFAQKVASLTHLHRLKASSILAYEINFKGGYWPSNSSEDFFKCSWFFHGEKAETSKSDLNLKHSSLHTHYERDFSPFSELHPYDSETAQYTHSLSELSPENRLILKNDVENPRASLPFSMALADPTVQTTVLLQEVEKHLALLSDKKFRMQLLLMFVKNVEMDQRIVSPFFLSLRKSSFIIKFERLITLAKRIFVDAQPASKPQLEEMLFCLRIYLRACFAIRLLHPDSVWEENTQNLMKELEHFLAKSFEHVDEKLQKEIWLVQMAFMLTKPLEEMSSHAKAQFLLEMVRFKNEFTSKMASVDPTLVRECKRQYYYFAEKWQKALKTSEECSAFGNAVLKKLHINHGEDLKWTFSDNQLISDSEDKWIIDLLEPSIRNKNGHLLEVYKELDSYHNFTRLFGNKRYPLKIVGTRKNQEIYFTSSVWGEIRIKRVIIERLIDRKWYTYFKMDSYQAEQFAVNHALVYDHAWWIDISNPQDIRVCDLKSGVQQYHTDSKGRIVHDVSGKLFYPISSENVTQFERLEKKEYISGWMQRAFEGQDGSQDLIELSRFKHAEDDAPLSFLWDGVNQKWQYQNNPNFYVADGPDIPIELHTDRFLHLVNQKGDLRKILIPVAEMNSKGYSQTSSLELSKGASDNQKGAIRFFEYSIKKGKLIPHSLEGRIYLAHLYLAQKNYKETASLLKGILITEKITRNVQKRAEDLVRSSKELKDFSPNASAVHLLCYYMLNKVDPTISLYGDPYKYYETYLDQLNNIEEALRLDRDQEIELLNMRMMNGGFHEFLCERKEELEKGKRTEKVYTTQHKGDSKAAIEPFFRYETPYSANLIFDKLFGGDDKERQLCQRLKENGSSMALENQSVLYDHSLKNPTQSAIALFAASYPEKFPEFPEDSATLETKKDWCADLLKLMNGLTVQKEAYRFNYPKSEEATSVTQLEIRVPKAAKSFSLPPILEESQDEHFKAWQQKILEKQGRLPFVQAKESKEQKLQDSYYAHAIAKHKAHYKKECEAAHQKREQKWVFKSTHSAQEFQALISEMKSEGQRAKKNEKELKEQIGKFIRRAPTATLLQFTEERATQLGLKCEVPTLGTILRAASQPNGIEALQKLNRHLSIDEAQALRAMCVELMIETTSRRHLESIYGPLEKWLTSNKCDKTAFEIAQVNMSEKRTYDPTKQLFPLFFEYLSKLRIREKQALIINDLLSHLVKIGDEALIGRAFQLIMAGGKTSVIISMLAELISEYLERVPCVLCHHSQFASVVGNLTEFQSKRFGKEIFVIDHTIEELSNEKILKQILAKLQEAKRKKCPVVMKTTFSQILEVKFVLESVRLLQIKDFWKKNDPKNRLEILREINLFFKKECIAIYDECDINLSILTDVIIPIGTPETIKAEWAVIVKVIYETLLDPQINQFINLTKNEQANLSIEDYQKHVIPHIVEKLFNHPSLLLSNSAHYKNAFGRYVRDLIPEDDQKTADRLSNGERFHLSHCSVETKENIAFLEELARREESTDRYKKESVQLIALARQMIDKILSIAFTRSYNRNYGRDPTQDDGRVIPYLGVSSPAKTKFGNANLALAYQLQSSLNAPISAGEIKFLGKKMYEAATYYAAKEKINFLDTEEAKQFKEMTSVSLADIDTESGIKQAFEYVNDDEHRERRLELEAEVAPFHIHSYPQKIKSNSINSVQQFAGSICCSATVWNRETYNPSILTMLDVGTEGSILNIMRERAKEYERLGLTYIHEIPEVVSKVVSNVGPGILSGIFALIQKHPDKQKFRGLLDAGGLLLDYTNAEVAHALKHFFQIEGIGCKGIIYLHQFSKEEMDKGAPQESFALLKVNYKEEPPIFLKNTTTAEIEIHVKKEDVCVYFCETGTTGWDFELADEALFFMTVDRQVPIRTVLQAGLRPRKFFQEQRVELALTALARKEMIGGGKTFDDLQKTWEMNEAILCKKQVDRARPEFFENVGRANMIAHLLEIGPKDWDYEKYVKLYEKFLVMHLSQNLYLEEKIRGTASVRSVLEEHSKRMLANLPEKIKNESVKQVEAIKTDLFKTLHPDEKMRMGKLNDMETEIHEEHNVELAFIEQNAQVEINRELFQEWETYNFKVDLEERKEEAWCIDPADSFWPQIKDRLSVSKTLFCTQFGEHRVSNKVEKYAAAFPENLYMTHDFYQTANVPLPLLHHLTRELKFILCFEETVVFLSQKEGAYFSEWIYKHQPKDIFLYGINGINEIDPTIRPNASHLRALLYANLFEGNLDFLDEHSELAKTLFKEHLEILADYVQVKMLSRRGKNHTALMSKVFDFSKSGTTALNQKLVLFSSRRKALEKKYYAIRDMGPNLIAVLDPENVPDISPSQVPWLTTRPQVAKLEGAAFIKELTEKQIVDGLHTSAQVPLLFYKSQIEVLHKVEDLLLLEEKQLELLTKDQKRDLVEALNKMPKNRLADKHLALVEFTTKEIEVLSMDRLFKIHKAHWSKISNPKLQEYQKSHKLSTDQVQQLGATQFAVLESKYANDLSNHQIKTLLPTHTHLIHELVDPGKLSHLNNAALQEIKEELVGKLNSPTFDCITKENLLICSLREREFNYVQKDRFRVALYTKEHLLKYLKLRPNYYSNLDYKHVELLDTEEHFLKLDDKQIGWLLPQQIQDHVNDVGLLTKIVRIKKSDACLNLEQKQILIGILESEEALSKLSDEELKWVKPEQVRLVTKAPLLFKLLLLHENHFFPYLQAPQVRLLDTEDQLKNMIGEQIQWIMPEQMQYIHTQDFLLSILDVHPEYIKVLNQQQVPLLTMEKHLLELDDKQLPWLTPAQMPLITDHDLLLKVGAIDDQKPNLSVPQRETRLGLLNLQSNYTTDRKIVVIVATVIVSLIAIAALLIGCMALTNASLAGAPQFFIDIMLKLRESVAITWVLTAGGGVVFIGSATGCSAYFIYHHIRQKDAF